MTSPRSYLSRPGFLAGSALVATVIRRIAGTAAISRYKSEIDGVNVLMLFVFVSAVMENVAANLIAAPIRMLIRLRLGCLWRHGVMKRRTQCK